MKFNKIDVKELTPECFPLIIDFDLKSMKPRGGSTKIDFFESGKLCDYVADFGGSKVIYLKKDSIWGGVAILLVDFDKSLKEPEYFKEIISGMQLEEAYVEDSRRFQLTAVLEQVEMSATLVSFL